MIVVNCIANRLSGVTGRLLSGSAHSATNGGNGGRKAAELAPQSQRLLRIDVLYPLRRTVSPTGRLFRSA